MNWLDSMYSEVNDDYVSNPYPTLGETVTIRFRCFRDNTISRAFLRTVINGGNVLRPMHPESESGRFVYYATKLKISQRWMSFHFILETPQTWYFFNRREVITYHPVEDYDWVIIADFENPSWVPRSVFYQIFPDRFRNGDPSNDIETGSYEFNGHKTVRLSWGTPAPRYEESYSLDFYGGDLQGIREKLSYLKGLGVTAVYVNPIFCAKTSHGYDCTDYFHVAPHFGGDRALVELSEELHRNGMRLMVDVSINHTGSKHHWFVKALSDPQSPERSYYYFDADGNYSGWAGIDTLPQLNYSSEKLRELIIRDGDSVVCRYILPPFGIDGWRFDVGNNTGQKDEHQFSHEIFREVRSAVKSTRKDAYIIGEHWEYNVSYHLGDQWDGAMNYFASGRPLRVFAGEVDHFLEGVAGKGTKRLPGSGKILAEQIMQHFQRLPNYHAFLQFNLLDSHDIHRFHNNEVVFDWEIYRGMVIIMFLLPGTPSIYYGDEIALGGYIDAVEGCRYPMDWDESSWNRNFLSLYRTLAFLKQHEPALHYGGYRVLFSDIDLMSFARFTREKAFIGIISHSRSERNVELPVAILGAVDGTHAREIFSGHEFPVEDGLLKVDLPVKKSLLLSLAIEG